MPQKKLTPQWRAHQHGVVLLFVVIVLTAAFTISIGVFQVIVSQISASQTFENSYSALYAADQGIERTLYRDRQEHDFDALPADIPTQDPLSGSGTATVSGGCFFITITKISSPPGTNIVARGLSTACGLITERTVARAFHSTY